MCTVKYVANKNSNNYRAAVVISKKVAKSAPKRNRIRRRIYEVLRTQGVSYIMGYDVAVIVFSDKLATVSHEELSQSLVDLLSKIRHSS
jgi:ribonuclease P protein component